MARPKTPSRKQPKESGIRITIPRLIVFGGLLVGIGGLITWLALAPKTRSGAGTHQTGLASATQAPPWGEFVTREIALERPQEYLQAELKRPQAPSWVFEKMGVEQVRAHLVTCGLDSNHVEHVLSGDSISVTEGNTIVHPDNELVLSMAPQTRARLYAELGRSPANHYMYFPFSFEGKHFDTAFENSNLDDTIISQIRRLLYPRGERQCFSDFEVVMSGLRSEQERLSLLKALSRQHALLVRLRIGPQTDIDKLLDYWSHGHQARDARPLLESLKRLPEGGTLSLLYLLPRFARDRLYTYPPPEATTDIPLDCHWTTMNFFNDNPDERFASVPFTVQYLKISCYPVAKAERFGDMIFVLNSQGDAVHSCVYLAEEIVFTKNGNDCAQPWMLMRLKDVVALYSQDPGTRLAVYRQRPQSIENQAQAVAALKKTGE